MNVGVCVGTSVGVIVAVGVGGILETETPAKFIFTINSLVAIQPVLPSGAFTCNQSPIGFLPTTSSSVPLA